MCGKRHMADIPWREKPVMDGVYPDDEQTAALEELFSSRISVLIGPAGTGKTTLLKLICQTPEVKKGGVRELAPTGKTRVRLEKQTGIQGAQTVARFLLPSLRN